MSGSISIEEKVLQKIISVLSANNVIENYTKKRIYASHISSIEKPNYPAISLFVLFSKNLFSTPSMIQMTIQIDSWFPAVDFEMSDILLVNKEIRSQLHRQNLKDATIGINVAQCVENSAGPLLYEDDTGLFHFPAEYQITAGS